MNGFQTEVKSELSKPAGALPGTAETATINDPATVIDALSAKIRGLEYAIARQQAEQHADRPAQIADALRWMRARGVIPLYVGTVPDEEVKGNFIGEGRSMSIMNDEVAAIALEQVWFLSGAPIPEEAKDALRQAAKNGMCRW